MRGDLLILPMPRFRCRATWRSSTSAGRAGSRGCSQVLAAVCSVAEDGAASSMAGRFVSVLGVVVWCGFRAAVGRVLASTRTGRAPEVGSTAAAGRVTPMAVLVQPKPDPAAAGMLSCVGFGRYEWRAMALRKGEVCGSRWCESADEVVGRALR
jgi:hypothetical protein